MNHQEIVEVLLNQICEASPAAPARDQIPLDESLYEIGLLDSFGVIELVAFVEDRWSIRILDSELTQEKFGGINKMARLIADKTASP